MRNVKFDGIDEDLTAHNTPWIYYGVRGPFVGLFLALGCSWKTSDCRALMPEHERLTCVCSILTSCSELSRRAVSPAFASHLADRKPSPFLAVTHAVLTNWEYMDVIRLAADPKCSSNLVNSITTIDSLLKIRTLRGQLKKLFGLGGLASDQDFVSVLTVRASSYPYPPGLVATRDGRFDSLRYRIVSAGLLAGSELGPRGWLDDVRSFLCNSER
jgi:hypothetical protein